jgi:hypothetical protein
MAIIKGPLDCVKWNVRKWRMNLPTKSEKNLAHKSTTSIKDVETVLILG